MSLPLRRLVSVPGLLLIAALLPGTSVIWVPLAVIVDVARGRLRLPLVRLLMFGVWWAWIETICIGRALGLSLMGRGKNTSKNYAIVRWWAKHQMNGLRATTGIRPVLEGAEHLVSGNAVVLSRHASLADSLLSAWAMCVEANLYPRYVLKQELLADPCLDIVGSRVPNHFLDRGALDGSVELAALRELSAGVGPGVVAVIFAEGTRANDKKRQRALEKIAVRDPARAELMSALTHLIPPRPAGSLALLEGAPSADVVVAWHTGFDGLDSFGGIISKLAKPLPPVRFVVRRVPRADVPDGERFAAWLDKQWLLMDAEVSAALLGS